MSKMGGLTSCLRNSFISPINFLCCIQTNRFYLYFSLLLNMSNSVMSVKNFDHLFLKDVSAMCNSPGRADWGASSPPHLFLLKSHFALQASFWGPTPTLHRQLCIQSKGSQDKLRNCFSALRPHGLSKLYGFLEEDHHVLEWLGTTNH